MTVRNKALQAAEGSKVTALAFVWIQLYLTSKIRLQFPVVVCKDLKAGVLVRETTAYPSKGRVR